MNTIGIVIIATNAYFVLGIRFVKRFMHHYKGNYDIKFFFVSDESPYPYLPDNLDVHFVHQLHTTWVAATNSKFKNILNLRTELADTKYVYYFDADTNVNQDFTEEWFLGELVGGEHFGNRRWLSGCVGYDTNPISAAYVPADTPLPCTYYYGAFFGGTTPRMLEFCQTLYGNQLKDKRIGYEPCVNDESYINQYFHYSPPTHTVLNENFKFSISDKGKMQNTRNTNLNTDHLKHLLLMHKNTVIDIQDGEIKYVEEILETDTPRN